MSSEKNILDDIERIKKIDKSNVYESILDLRKQCTHAFEATKDIKIPSSYSNIENLVMTGMGGSGLGARVIESVYKDNLKIPLIRVNDYDIPGWVGEKTLVVCSSYSGNTEETISTFNQALKRKCKIIVISAGGKIVELAERNNIPYYKIDPKYNPSNQPRMAIGYSILGQILLLKKANIIGLNKKGLESIVAVMEKVVSKNKFEINTDNNQAKKLANLLKDHISITISARHLAGAVHTFKNQQNENSKNLSIRFDIPEINHHLLEGLTYPKRNKKDLIFIFLNSELYPKRISQRMFLTREIVAKQKIQDYSWKAKSLDPLSQSFEFIQFGAFVNFYLGMLYGIDPAPIPWVDYFKKHLSQT